MSSNAIKCTREVQVKHDNAIQKLTGLGVDLDASPPPTFARLLKLAAETLPENAQISERSFDEMLASWTHEIEFRHNISDYEDKKGKK